MESAVVQRIKMVMAELNSKSIRDFSLSIDAKPSTIQGMIDRGTNPGFSVIEKIINAYPFINANWLISGSGNMIKNSNDNVSINKYTPKYNEEVLHHYTTAKGLFGILSPMRLDFSELEESSDAKERRMIKYYSKKDKQGNKGINRYKLVSFFIKDDNREIRQPRMWDTYADRLSGACIEFDKQKLQEKNKAVEFKNVEYDQFFKDKNSIRESIGCKFYSWMDEHECRGIYYGGEIGLDISGCIKRIYIGPEFKSYNIDKLAVLIHKIGIPLDLFCEVSVTGEQYLSCVSDSNSPSIISQEISRPKLSASYKEYEMINKTAEYTNILTDENADSAASPYLITKSGTEYYECHNGGFKMVVPFVPIRVSAGYVDNYADAIFIDSLDKREFYVGEVHHGRYFSFEIQGDSMTDGGMDSICDKNVVLARELSRDKWQNLSINKYKYWIIVTKDDVYCKQISKQSESMIVCHSLNADPKYSDFELNLDDEVVKLFNIIKVERNIVNN